MENKSVQDFREKLNEIVTTLNYLNDKYNMQYVLNCLSIDQNQYILNETYYNKDINPIELEFIAYQITILQKNLGHLSSLLSSGKTVVVCKSDDQKTEGYVGDWIKKGEIYLVNVMHRVDDGFLYELDGMKINRSTFPGFHSKRFQRVFSNEFLN